MPAVEKIMERLFTYTPIRVDGVVGYKLPYSYKLLPSGGRVVVVAPNGESKLVSRKTITRH